MNFAQVNAYLGTRVNILRDQLLPVDFFEGMIGKRLEEILSIRFGDVDFRAAPDIGMLERTLMRAMLRDVTVILRPLQGAARSFFLYWARRFELFNLKAMIRGKLRGLPEREIEPHLLHMPPFTVLPHESMLRAETVAELLRLVEAGPYASLAGQARRVLEENQDTHAVEAAIDQRYYMGLAKRVHQLPKADADPTHDLMGTVIDRINLSWLVRYRFVYRLSPTETYYFLIRHGHHLHREHLLRLVELDSIEAIVAAMPPALGDALTDARTALDIEQGLDRLVRQRATQAVRYSGSVVTRAIAYLTLREQQLAALRALIFGTRLGLSPELMRAAMRLAPELES